MMDFLGSLKAAPGEVSEHCEGGMLKTKQTKCVLQVAASVLYLFSASVSSPVDLRAI